MIGAEFCGVFMRLGESSAGFRCVFGIFFLYYLVLDVDFVAVFDSLTICYVVCQVDIIERHRYTVVVHHV